MSEETTNPNEDQTTSEPTAQSTSQQPSIKEIELQDQVNELTDRIEELSGQLESITGDKTRLLGLLTAARDQLAALQEEVDRLGQPPSAYGVLLGKYSDGTVDVFVSGRKMRLVCAPNLEVKDEPGRTVRLNEALTVIEVCDYDIVGEICTLRNVLEGGRYAVVVGRTDDERVVQLAEKLLGEITGEDGEMRKLRAGDSLVVETKAGIAIECIPKSEVDKLVLEEVPDVSYDDVGGLGRQIEQIRDAVELPYLHRDLFRQYELTPPKGILLYGPPGCGKTLIAKAVANSLAQKVRAQKAAEEKKAGTKSKSDIKAHFINIKGPELLNKYVGETERHIREVFQLASEKAKEGMPVIVFFDEMESLFRTRGSGVSSDVESTIVPQLLSVIDGVEGMENVVVIGASNREDMIDPAVLRPGRLDVKIKVERPDAEAAIDIFSKYLVDRLPVHPKELVAWGGNRQACVQSMIQKVVFQMYAESDQNRFLEITYANGDKEITYFKDFNSGAMIKNVVDRAKKYAIKAHLDGDGGLQIQHLMQAIVDEFAENEDLPNTTNPDDWARISGKKGERIVYIRTLIKGRDSTGNREIKTATTGAGEGTGQYL